MLIKSLVLSASMIMASSAFADDVSQISGNMALIKSYEVKMLEFINKAKLLKESIGSNSQMNGSINCAEKVPSSFQGRCSELLSVIQKYHELEVNSKKLQNIVSELNTSVTFPKIANDTSSVDTTEVLKSKKDIYEMDKTTPDCKGDHMKGWKCWNTTITTVEGNTYNILLKWNRVNMPSRGTVFYGIGGAGMGESREDKPSRDIMDQVSELDQVRTVALEMMDTGKKDLLLSGGYWQYAGGYKTLAQIFQATVELSVEKNLLHGSFTNYFGGSNGSMLAASGFSLYNTDVYFDRAILQMGPFLSDFPKACNKESESSFSLDSLEKQKYFNQLLGTWTYHDNVTPVCDRGGEDRNSILLNGKKEFPNTRIHVIIGAREVDQGFGKWILASNLEWFNSIEAKSKERIVRPNLAHNNSYEDMRRFMRLAPDEVATDANLECSNGSFDSNGEKIGWSCGCGTVEGGIIMPNGCFHIPPKRALASVPASPQVTTGVFCGQGTEVQWSCGTTSSPGEGWHNMGNNCYHLSTSNKCKN